MRSVTAGSWARRAALVVVAGAVVASPMAGEALANRAAVPTAPVTLPAAVDWQAEYQGQHLCSPEAKPGAQRLSDLLDATYGSFTTYISRSCATPGISEHEEGRAIDWMVDSEIAAQRTKAWQFLNWLTATGAGGEPGAMARRLGIMYLIYEDKMWRVYRPEDGWTEYSGCSAKPSESYDTSCHRDHIHISLTWDGAYARTSFWTGRAETRGPCESATTTRASNGTPADPVMLINGNKGIGVAGDACRLAADAYSDRTYRVRVPVPERETPVQRIEVGPADINAPVGMTITSATTVTVPPGTKAGSVVAVPLKASGEITVTLGAGYGDVVLKGVGTGAGGGELVSPEPPTVGLRPLAATFINSAVTATGRVQRADTAQVEIHRRVAPGAWATVAQGAAASGRYSIVVPPASTAGTYEYKAVISQSGGVLDESRIRTQQVKPAAVTVTGPAKVARRTAVRFTGVANGATTAGHLDLQIRGSGRDAAPREWRSAKLRPHPTSGAYTIVKHFRHPGRVVVRTVLRSGSAAESPVVARSAPLRVIVRR